MSRLSEMIEKLCPDGVEYRKLGEVCNLVAGSDVPKNRFSEHITDEYSVPVYSNGVEEKSLYGYTDIPAITEPCVTISARGTIGYAALRIKPFFPIIRLICVIPDESINVRFLFHVLEMSTYRSPQTGIPQLTIPMVKKHLVPVPPLPIQNEIVKLLDNFTELTAELTAELQLRKKGSLSNVVEKYYRKISGCLCSSALPCFVIEHIENAAAKVFKVPESIADTL